MFGPVLDVVGHGGGVLRRVEGTVEVAVDVAAVVAEEEKQEHGGVEAQIFLVVAAAGNGTV